MSSFEIASKCLFYVAVPRSHNSVLQWLLKTIMLGTSKVNPLVLEAAR